MMSRTTATLECAAQVSAAAITMQKTGSWVIAARSDLTRGASSAGAKVSTRMCNASKVSPSPIAMRPSARVRL